MAADKAYEPGDGVSRDFSDVKLRGLVIVGSAQGAPATLVGTVLNESDAQVKVDFGLDPAAVQSLAVPPRGVVVLGRPGAAPITFAKLTAAPGGIANVYVGTPKDGDMQVSVPVVVAHAPYESSGPSGAPSPSLGHLVRPTAGHGEHAPAPGAAPHASTPTVPGHAPTATGHAPTSAPAHTPAPPSPARPSAPATPPATAIPTATTPPKPAATSTR